MNTISLKMVYIKDSIFLKRMAMEKVQTLNLWTEICLRILRTIVAR